MAVYESKYPELKFYVDGQLHAFYGGSFSTTDAKVIAVLDGLADAIKVEEEKAEEAPTKPKAPAKKATASAK
ncbi:hypothetical protein [Bacillus sp. JJ722]|uniref:hypothetical protein n=1 Tax=Bacillus sp. JJ722 TaxID=3122973 RepID=UPI003000EF1D